MSNTAAEGTQFNIEILLLSLHLVTNLVAESNEVALCILQRTNLIDAIVLATQESVCNDKMLGMLVWLSGALI